MKRLLLIVFALLILNIPFIGNSRSNKLVFNTQDFPPFSYMKNNHVRGPGAEIIRLVCKEMGIRCSFNLLPWRRAVRMAKAGKANGLFVIGWNKPRTEWLYFSHPILTTEYGIFVHKNNKLKFKTIKNLGGYTVGVFGPSNTSNSLKKIAEQVKNMRIDMTPDDIAPFKKLNLGRIDAVYSNKDVGCEIIRQNKLKNIRYAGIHKKLKYYIGFLKKYNNKKTVDKFNAALKKLYKKGNIRSILNKYNISPAEIK